MRLLLVAVVLGLCVQAHAQQSNQIRYVFKGDTVSVRGAQAMSFGLSKTQASKIRELTQGQVDFSSYYFVDRAADDIQPMETEPGYSGKIYPGVPPPVHNPPYIRSIVADPELETQWWIEKLGVKDAWTMATGQGVTLADCDAGFYWHESDLNDNILSDLRYDLSDAKDPFTVDDGGYTSHGTAVTAIIAGVKNGAGTNGIAFNAKIVPLQNYNYSSKDGLDKEESTAKCVLHAISTPGVQIIVLENQMANGSSEAFAGTRDAVRLALQAGIIVVGAGGNNSVHLNEETKDDTGSIIVGALMADESTADFTNYGDRLTVGAFGEKLHTLYGPDGQFGEFGGTSGATPQVAATVALMREINPMLTPAQTRQILQDTRTLTDANKKGGGKLNTAVAVAKARMSRINTDEWAAQWLFRQRLSSILMER